MLTQKEYNAKRQERYERLLAAANRAKQEAEAKNKQAHSLASVIPFGQPILVGHYSERRDRNYRQRIENNFRKGYELYKQSQELQSRAESIANNDAIYSDDPSAVEQLQAKIDEAEKLQEMYKAVNAAYRRFVKNPASLDSADLPEEYKALIKNFKPEWSKDQPIPSFRLSNNNANIRRLKQRAAQVSRKQSLEDHEEVIGEITIEYVPTENQIRIHFPERVPYEQYKELRSHGFRSMKSTGKEAVFSAFYNNNALWYIKEKIK